MKKLLALACTACFFFGVIGNANSALFDRGSGLIYDDVLDITWLQDANYAMTSGHDTDGMMAWIDAVAWADGLEYYDSIRDVTWTDWRLPRALPVDGANYDYNLKYDGSTDYGYNISAPGSAYPGNIGSEMAHLYYNSLGNLGYYDTSGNPAQPGWGLQNTGPFVNLTLSHPYIYWSGTEYTPDPTRAFHFYFYYGAQPFDSILNHRSAWAVRDGDVAPIPEAVDIDIKPGSYPNCFNNNGHGVIPLAILGSADFDCTQVDPETVSLEGLSIKMVGKGNKYLAHYEDVNHDGYDDLVLQIEDSDAVFQEGQTTATLTGNLYEEYGGTEIEGTDTICIVP